MTEFRSWSRTAFQRDTAWVFVPYNRNIYFLSDGKTVWVDELLETWMGVSRGSGVLFWRNGTWKRAHYHLAVTVPNDKIQEYLKLNEIK